MGAQVPTADAQRVLDRCDDLAAVSASPDGVERVHLSPEHARVNAVVAGWMAEVGLDTRVDQAGNLWGRLEGREPGLPALVLGSHLDTVPTPAATTGSWGSSAPSRSCAGCATCRGTAVRPRGRGVLRRGGHAVRDGAHGEFGRRRGVARGVVGPHRRGRDDRPEAAEAFGLDPARIGEAARRPEELLGYLELHIEQGPHLEAADRALGVVTSIAGARRFTGRVVGEARHAGGTPYPRRRDALVGASEVVLAVERLAKERDGIATVGRLQAFPGGVNVVPGLVEFSLDVRDEHDADRDALVEEIRAVAERACAARGLTLELTEVHSAPGVYCDEALQRSVAAGIAATGDAEPLRLWSRAGHDAMAVAAVTRWRWCSCAARTVSATPRTNG